MFHMKLRNVSRGTTNSSLITRKARCMQRAFLVMSGSWESNITCSVPDADIFFVLLEKSLASASIS